MKSQLAPFGLHIQHIQDVGVPEWFLMLWNRFWGRRAKNQQQLEDPAADWSRTEALSCPRPSVPLATLLHILPYSEHADGVDKKERKEATCPLGFCLRDVIELCGRAYSICSLFSLFRVQTALAPVKTGPQELHYSFSISEGHSVWVTVSAVMPSAGLQPTV